VGGIILLTRILGPEAYGVYAIVAGIYLYVAEVSRWGLDYYLIRHEGDLQQQDYHQASTLLLLFGLVSFGLMFLALPFLERYVNVEGFGLVATTMFAVVPIGLLAKVPLARLERALDYRRVAVVEILGQMTLYSVAVPLAYIGGGALAPAAGYGASQLLMLVVLCWVSGYRPRPYWDPARVRAMLRYGVGYSASVSVWVLRYLVNPLVVGPYAGAAAAGYVNLAIRTVESLGFVQGATFRLSIAALSRVQRDRARLLSAINEGMQLQVLALGPFLVGFVLVAPWLLPLLLGSSWLPMLQVYPFIALGHIVHGVSNMHTSAFYARQRNWQITIFHLVYVALFVGSSLWLVPRMGIIGYGWATVIAMISYGVIHLYTVKEIGTPSYGLVGSWVLAFGVALFWLELGWAAWLGLVGVSLWPGTWRALGGYVRSLRREQSK
jgi:PST family polysaccharide transporter